MCQLITYVVRLADEESILFAIIFNVVVQRHNNSVAEQTEANLVGISGELENEVGHVAKAASEGKQHDFQVHERVVGLEIAILQELVIVKDNGYWLRWCDYLPLRFRHRWWIQQSRRRTC